ncbi:MAG: protein kinase [Archangium sp.]|nr:protein kinase [Archangium sp.]
MSKVLVPPTSRGDGREGLGTQLSDGLKSLRIASLPKSEVQKNPDGVWVVTEAVEGESLRWVMRTLAKQSGFIAPNEGLAVVAKVAQTLDGLHRAGLAHGDICPTTIWITQQGDVVLRDAGIATALGVQGDLGPYRSEMHYIAPEQITGTPGGKSDLFRLGLLLYELAIGKPLWPGPTPAHVCHAAVSWQGLQREQVKGVPEPWLTLLVTMLQSDPDARPAMEEVTAILDQALKQNRWSATPADIARLFARAAAQRAPLFDASGGATTELMLTPIRSAEESAGARVVSPSGGTASVTSAPSLPAVTPPGAVVARIATKKMTREELAAVKIEGTPSQPGLEKLPPEFRAAMSLVEKGMISRQQLETARSTSIVDGTSLFVALVNVGADEDQLISTLGEQTKTPCVNSKKVLEAIPGPEGVALISVDLSRAARAIPLGIKGGTQVLVAMADPMDANALELLKAAIGGRSLVTFRAGERAMSQARARIYGVPEMELESSFTGGGSAFDPLALVQSASSSRDALPTVPVDTHPTSELAGRVVGALLKLQGTRGAQGEQLVSLATDLAERAGLSAAEIDLARVASGAMVACALLANRQPWDVPKLTDVQDTVGFGSPVEPFVEGLHNFPARMPEKPVVKLVVLAFAFAMHSGDPRPSGARVQGALNSFKSRMQLAPPLFDALAGVLS